MKTLLLIACIIYGAVALSRTDNDLPSGVTTVLPQPEVSPLAVTSPVSAHQPSRGAVSSDGTSEDDEDLHDYSGGEVDEQVDEEVDYELSGASEGAVETEHLMAAVRAGPTTQTKPAAGKGKKGKKGGKGNKKGKKGKGGKGRKGKKTTQGESQTRGHFSECPVPSYCVHGTCQFVEALQQPQCVCPSGYMGPRCESATLPVTKEEESRHTRTIALAALVISCLALIVCAVSSVLFSRRSKRRRDMDLESLTGKYREGRN